MASSSSSFSWPVVSTISEEVIKPSSPTPSIHRFHKLSLHEQSLTHIYIPLAFFYSKEQVSKLMSKDGTKIYHRLVHSLSDHLVTYYPFAGTLIDNATIECDDRGAKFLQVKIHALMLDVLNHPNSDIRDLVFPPGLAWADDSPDGFLLVVQLTYFLCGGIAVSTCMSHKIGDGSSSYYFHSDWAAIARDPNNNKYNASLPYFVQDRLFPLPPNCPTVSPIAWPKVEGGKQARYVFTTAKIKALKDYVAKESEVKNPTRTEVVCALIFKCAVVAAAKVTGVSVRESLLLLEANLRSLITPKLPSKSIGNVFSYVKTTIANEEDLNIPKIVALMRKEKQLLQKKDHVKENEWTNEIMEYVRKGEKLSSFCVDKFWMEFSSLALLPFHETMDFGWGKYVNLITANDPTAKYVFLFEEATGDIEAFFTLKQQHMDVFQRDPLVLKFATPVPALTSKPLSML